MTMCELLGRSLADGVSPVYATMLGMYFRLDDGVSWDTFRRCMALLSELDATDKEWNL